MNEVGICNLALSHLGDTATVTSIKPPDSSKQAQLCARFYWVARDAVLEMHAWNFATRRATLALLQEVVCDSEPRVYPDGSPATWRFQYALPGDLKTALSVIPPNTPDDYEVWFGPTEHDHFPPYPQGYLPVPGAPLLVTQPYSIETQLNGTKVLLTNVCGAVLRYVGLVEDTTKFSTLFTLALSHLLASMLAGPIIKGDAGAQAATQQLEMFNSIKGTASSADANERKTHLEAAPSFIRGR